MRRPDAPLNEAQRAMKRAAETREKRVESPPRSQFPGFGCCVWPHGDTGTPDFHFCGASAAEPGAPYCHKHMAVAYVAPGRRKAELASIEKAAERITGRLAA